MSNALFACDEVDSRELAPETEDIYQMHFYDTVLALELAEHALLIRLGFYWRSQGNQDVDWVAPPRWNGSCTVYESRSHAINSVKKYRLGIGKDRGYGKGEYK